MVIEQRLQTSNLKSTAADSASMLVVIYDSRVELMVDDAVGDCEAVLDAVPVTELDVVADEVDVDDTVADAVRLAVPVAVLLAVCELDCVAEAVREELALAVAVPVIVAVIEVDGVWVTVPVLLLEDVAEVLAVWLALAVTVAVPDADKVAVPVAARAGQKDWHASGQES